MSGTAPRPIVILGPTAGGKSELAVTLAERMKAVRGVAGEVIGADSMQVYRRLDAGTAKPSPAQRARAAHHLIDLVEPTERFTVADWLALADELIESLPERGVAPIVVGGTNFYIRALLEGLFDGPPIDNALRARLQSFDNAALHETLQRIDPASAQRIHPNDRKRMIRAIEVFEQTGKPMSQWQTQWEDWGMGEGQGPWAKGQAPRAEGQGQGEKGKGRRAQGQGTEALAPLPPSEGPGEGRPPIDLTSGTVESNPSALGPRPWALPHYRHNPILIGLHWPTEAINPRINLRVKAMFFPDKVDAALAAEVTPRGESLVDEVRRLEAAGLLGPQARMALGYQQVLDHLAGRCTLDEAFEKTKILTRRFAKSQRTWLKRFSGVKWLDASTMTANELADAALAAM